MTQLRRNRRRLGRRAKRRSARVNRGLALTRVAQSGKKWRRRLRLRVRHLALRLAQQIDERIVADSLQKLAAVGALREVRLDGRDLVEIGQTIGEAAQIIAAGMFLNGRGVHAPSPCWLGLFLL